MTEFPRKWKVYYKSNWIDTFTYDFVLGFKLQAKIKPRDRSDSFINNVNFLRRQKSLGSVEQDLRETVETNIDLIDKQKLVSHE